jgi:hypothetical protein
VYVQAFWWFPPGGFFFARTAIALRSAPIHPERNREEFFITLKSPGFDAP